MLQCYAYFLHLEESLITLLTWNYHISCPHQRHFYQTYDSINDCFLVGSTIPLKMSKYRLNRFRNVAAIEYLPFRLVAVVLTNGLSIGLLPLMSCITALIDHPTYSFQIAESHRIKSKSLLFTCTKVRENNAKIIRRID